MSEVFTLWNSVADAWLAWMAERSLAGAAVLGVVLVVLLVIPRRRVSAHALSHLLLVPLLVIVVPVERLLPGGFPRPLPALASPSTPAEPAGSADAPRQRSSPTPSRAVHADAGANAEPGGPPPASPGPSWPALAFAVWALVAATGLVILVRRHRRAATALARAGRPAEPLLARRFERLVREAGLDQPVELRLARGLSSPLVGGLRRPTVYVPSELVHELGSSQLRFVLRHELEHVRRRDVLTGALTASVKLAFWFHPGVWLAAALADRWREYACDEAALARAGGRRVEAADTLYALVARTSDRRIAIPVHAPFLSPRTHMRHRLLRILDARRRPRAHMSPFALASLALTSIVTVTAARPQQAGTAAATPTDRTAPEVAVHADEVAKALTEGAAWLLRNQQADGSWAIGPDPAGENQRDHNEVCITAMAVRALLPGLRDEKLGIVPAVRAATAFLQEGQHADGRFGPEEALTMMYAHANTLRALCAVQREWPDDALRRSIELGVAWALKARNPYMGWRYTPRCGDNDSKITSMMLFALADAKALGVEIDPTVFEEALRLLDQLTEPNTGRTGFVSTGTAMSRFTSKKDRFPGRFSEEPTAMALLARIAAKRPIDDPVHRRGIELVAALQPVWDPEAGTIDLAYWEFGAELMRVAGGAQADRWRERLHAALIPNRVTAEGGAHWPAIDAWSHPGMEVYTTASALLALRALR